MSFEDYLSSILLVKEEDTEEEEEYGARW